MTRSPTPVQTVPALVQDANPPPESTPFPDDAVSTLDEYQFPC